jgi:putative isomerase
MNKKKILFILASISIVQYGWTQKHFPNLAAAKNSINYKGDPKNATDRNALGLPLDSWTLPEFKRDFRVHF